MDAKDKANAVAGDPELRWVLGITLGAVAYLVWVGWAFRPR